MSSRPANGSLTPPKSSPPTSAAVRQAADSIQPGTPRAESGTAQLSLQKSLLQPRRQRAAHPRAVKLLEAICSTIILKHPKEIGEQRAQADPQDRQTPRRVRLHRRHDRPLRHRWNTKKCSATNSNSRDGFVRRQLRRAIVQRSSSGPAKSNPARSRSTAANTNRRRCARGCGKINSGELRDFISERDQIQIQRTRLVENFLRLRGQIPFPVRAIFSTAIPAFHLFAEQSRRPHSQTWANPADNPPASSATAKISESARRKNFATVPSRPKGFCRESPRLEPSATKAISVFGFRFLDFSEHAGWFSNCCNPQPPFRNYFSPSTSCMS